MPPFQGQPRGIPLDLLRLLLGSGAPQGGPFPELDFSHRVPGQGFVPHPALVRPVKPPPTPRPVQPAYWSTQVDPGYFEGPYNPGNYDPNGFSYDTGPRVSPFGVMGSRSARPLSDRGFTSLLPGGPQRAPRPQPVTLRKPRKPL